ncbi:MAG: PilN domain-containing protein [Candidatus Omnitrophota bacterium]
MGKRTAVIEKCDSFMKVALVHGRGPGVTVERVLKVDLGPRSTIGEVLQTADLSYDDIILVAPRNNVIVKQFDLPTTDPKEVSQIIDIKVGRLTPFPKKEFVYGFEAIPVEGGVSTKALVGIVQNTVINMWVSQFRGGSVPVQRIVFGSECFALLAPVITQKLCTETFAILDLDSDSADFCVISGSRLIFTKLVHFGTHDLERGHWEERFVEEIHSVYAEFKTQNFRVEFNKVMFFNLTDTQGEALTEVLYQRFQLDASPSGESLGRVLWTGSAERSVKELYAQGVTFTKLFAAALYGDRTAIDFSPANVKQERVAGTQRKEFSKVLFLFMAVIAAVMLIVGVKAYVSELRLKNLDDQIALYEVKAAPVRTMLKRIRLVEDSRAKSHSVVRAIRDVPQKVPAGVYLSEISCARDSALSIRGTSRDNAQVFLFGESLRKEPLFRDVQVKYVTKRNDVNDFEILCLMAGSSK